MPTASTTERMLSATDVAQLIKISPRTLWRWEATGTAPPAVRRGRSFARFRESDINAWIANDLQWPPTSEAPQ